MPVFFGVPVDAAYHIVSAFVGILTLLLGGMAAATAIVLFTMAVRLLLVPLSYRASRGMDAQARMAPQVQALQKKHAGQPEALRREVAALYRAEGTTTFAGCLPVLAQWPVFSIMYLLFRSPHVGGTPNTLLSHDLFGAPLGSHWLGGAGPFSAHGAVFAGLFVLLAVIGWQSARMTRRFTTAGTQPGTPVQPAGPAPAGPAPAGPAPAGPAPSGVAPAGAAPVAVARFAPYLTVVVAAFLPLAAGLYLATTTAWTLAERAILRRVRDSKRSALGILRR